MRTAVESTRLRRLASKRIHAPRFRSWLDACRCRKTEVTFARHALAMPLNDRVARDHMGNEPPRLVFNRHDCPRSARGRIVEPGEIDSGDRSNTVFVDGLASRIENAGNIDPAEIAI